eukprot:tig00000571_g2160.t1
MKRRIDKRASNAPAEEDEPEAPMGPSRASKRAASSRGIGPPAAAAAPQPAPAPLPRIELSAAAAAVKGYTTNEQFERAERLCAERAVSGTWRFERSRGRRAGAGRSISVAATVAVRISASDLVASASVRVSSDGDGLALILAADCSCVEGGLLCSHTAAVLLCLGLARADKKALEPQE